MVVDQRSSLLLRPSDCSSTLSTSHRVAILTHKLCVNSIVDLSTFVASLHSTESTIRREGGREEGERGEGGREGGRSKASQHVCHSHIQTFDLFPQTFINGCGYHRISDSQPNLHPTAHHHGDTSVKGHLLGPIVTV